MSAVDEYRKECASRGLWPVPEDGSLLCIADAAIAELEAELETQLNWREHILRLEAELAALKGRRCGTCEANDKQYCPIPTRSNIIAARPSFSCSEWEARP